VIGPHSLCSNFGPVPGPLWPAGTDPGLVQFQVGLLLWRHPVIYTEGTCCRSDTGSARQLVRNVGSIQIGNTFQSCITGLHSNSLLPRAQFMELMDMMLVVKSNPSREVGSMSNVPLMFLLMQFWLLHLCLSSAFLPAPLVNVPGEPRKVALLREVKRSEKHMKP
jgi:hypothetical protein